MSIKMYFLFSHLDRLPENLDALGDEQGERFLQGISVIEKRYRARWDVVMIAD